MHPPDLSKIPEGPLGDAIRLGQRIVGRTFEELPQNVGNGLHCTSCHLDGGTRAGAAPWVGLPGLFPEYRARSGRVDTLAQRVNDCFERSMNGTALEPDSDAMVGILAYMSFISRGVPSGQALEGRGMRRLDAALTPDRAQGARIYAAKCESCHGADGAGRELDGGYLLPAVWGGRSFNIGAGLARLDTAAAYIRWNMPLGQGGLLTDQEALSVADYVIHQERPDFAGKERDWPNGGKPRDARY
ncbi:MAG: c-type cytochrome [Polyangiaceae bacterium]|nr:c-type cytochrome [Polyangiaceae bacterium]